MEQQGRLPGKIRLKSFLKSAEIVFNSDKVRKSISFGENSMCIIVSIGLYIQENSVDWMAYVQHNLFYTALEAGNPGSRCHHGQVLVRVLLWVTHCCQAYMAEIPVISRPVPKIMQRPQILPNTNTSEGTLFQSLILQETLSAYNTKLQGS